MELLDLVNLDLLSRVDSSSIIRKVSFRHNSAFVERVVIDDVLCVPVLARGCPSGSLGHGSSMSTKSICRRDSAMPT